MKRIQRKTHLEYILLIERLVQIIFELRQAPMSENLRNRVNKVIHEYGMDENCPRCGREKGDCED